MKKLLASASLCCLIVCVLVSSVSAQLPYFTVNFDRIDYTLGSTGTIVVDIQNLGDQSYDIKDIGVRLYFAKTDGLFYPTEFFGLNYTDAPLQVATNDNASVSFEFTIPQTSGLESGGFYYVFNVYIREQGTTTYYDESPGQREALSNEYHCILQVPETTTSPTPTTEPTPTPTSTPASTPTPTPTPTPTSTATPTPTPAPIDFFSAEVLIGIGIGIAIALVVIIIVLGMLKKKKRVS
jgi:hypothetical protein